MIGKIIANLKVLSSNSIEDLNNKINEYENIGWEIYGNKEDWSSITIKPFYMQAVILLEKEQKDNQ